MGAIREVGPPTAKWPRSWRDSHRFDQIEVFGDGRTDRGHFLSYATRLRETLDAVRNVAAPGASVLDIAAAQGTFSLALAEEGYDVTWNDLRVDLVDYVRAKWERGNVSFAPGNAFELGLEGSFDVVLITEVVEHVAHPDELLASALSFAKPDGHVVMTTPNGEYIRNKLPRFTDCADPSQFESVQFQPDADGHIFLLHLDEIQELADRCGARIVSTRFFGNPLTNGHLKLRAVLPLLPSGLVNACERVTSGEGFRRITRRANSHVAVVFHRPI